MIALTEMMKWNYKKAWVFFTENALQRYIPETEHYIRSLKKVETIDLRGNSNAKKIIIPNITRRTLILIDGPSANGKTTLAHRISKHIDGIVVDIDFLCQDWIKKHLQSIKSYREKMEFLNHSDELTDAYLLNELENIIRKKSKGNKPVILVGLYLEVIYRSIIAKTLGKYFDKTVSLLCCEKTFEQVKRFIRSRNAEFNTVVPDELSGCANEYYIAQNLISAKNREFLGFGMSASFIVDSEVSNMFK